MKKAFLLLFALVLLVSCTGCNRNAPPSSADGSTGKTPSTPAASGSGENLPSWQYARADDYPLLENTEECITRLKAEMTEADSLHVTGWRIRSFEFLEAFEGLKSLYITGGYIEPGAVLAGIECLSGLERLELCRNYGSGAADVLKNAAQLTALETLRLQSRIPDSAVLPKFPALCDLYLDIPDALRVASENTHITGALVLEQSDTTLLPISIAEIGAFSSVQYIELPPDVSDLSPLSGCRSLRILVLKSEAADSLAPLAGISGLEEIVMDSSVYAALSPAAQSGFTQDANGDSDAVHLYFSDMGALNSAGTGLSLDLRGETIDSFDFLSEHPGLRRLSIYNCDIAPGLTLPYIDTLTWLSVTDEDAISLLSGYTAFSGWLQIGSGYLETGAQPLTSLAGLEAFSSLQALTVMDPVTDISALAECKNLRRLSLMISPEIVSFEPLFSLSRLRELYIHPANSPVITGDEQAAQHINAKPYNIRISYRD